MSGAAAIRLAEPGDARIIAEMSRDLIEHGLGWSWTPRRVLHSIGDADTNAVLACDPVGARLGFGIMKYHEDDAHLLLLAVRDAYGRRGIGTALVDWLERAARTAGVGCINVETRAGNVAARAFYQRLGYVETRLLPGYYQGIETSVRMSKDLRQPRSALA